MLANIHTRLRSFKVQGNPLTNEGAYQLLRSVEVNDSLEKLNIADTGISLLKYEEGSLEEQVGNLLLSLMKKNSKILKYDIRFNLMSDLLAQKLYSAIENNPTIKNIEFPNCVMYELRDGLDTIVRKRTGGFKSKVVAKKKSKKK